MKARGFSEGLRAQVFDQVSPMGILLPAGALWLVQPAFIPGKSALSCSARGGNVFLAGGHPGKVFSNAPYNHQMSSEGVATRLHPARYDGPVTGSNAMGGGVIKRKKAFILRDGGVLPPGQEGFFLTALVLSRENSCSRGCGVIYLRGGGMSGTARTALCKDRGKQLILTDRFSLSKVEKKNRRIGSVSFGKRMPVPKGTPDKPP
jgi:hypothetical protein